MDVGEDQRRQNMKLTCIILLLLACTISGEMVAADSFQECAKAKDDLLKQINDLQKENAQLKVDIQKEREAWDTRGKIIDNADNKIVELKEENTRLRDANTLLQEQNCTNLSASQENTTEVPVLTSLRAQLKECKEVLHSSRNTNTTSPNTPDEAKTPETSGTAETPTHILVDDKANTSSEIVFWSTMCLVASVVVNVLFCMCYCNRKKNRPATVDDFEKWSIRVEKLQSYYRTKQGLTYGIFTMMMKSLAPDFIYYRWIELKTYPVYIMDFFCVIDSTLLVTLWLMISLVVFVSYELYHQASYAKSMEDVNSLVSWVFEGIQMLLNWLNVDVKWLIAPVCKMANQHLCPPAYGWFHSGPAGN